MIISTSRVSPNVVPNVASITPVAVVTSKPPQAPITTETPVPVKTPSVAQPVSATLISPKQPIVAEPLISYYPEGEDPTLMTTQKAVTISHFESDKHFYAQLLDAFAEFDAHFEQFQESCNSQLGQSMRLTRDKIMLSNLAIAAVFTDDENWYRAKIGTHSDFCNKKKNFEN